MRPITRLAQLTAVTAVGMSLAACGSSSSNGTTTAAHSGSSSATSAAPSSSSGTGSSGSASSATTGHDQAGLPSGTTLIHQTRAAYKAAKSADLRADITDTDGTNQKTRMKGTMDGTNQEVTVDQGTTKGVVTIRSVGGKYYMKGNEIFWNKGSGAPVTTAKLLAGKWVIAPASSATGFKELTINNFLDQALGNVSDAELAKAKVATTSYQGKDAYAVTSARTKNTVTIDAHTKDILEFDSPKTSSNGGTATVSGWNQQPRFSTPPGAINLPSGAK